MSANAALFLNISIVNKKGIDKGLTLGSELHSIEEVRSDRNIELKMKSGIQVILRAYFPEEKNLEHTMGPSHKVVVEGAIFKDNGKLLKSFEKEPVRIALDTPETLTHSQDSQLVELTITPVFK